MKEEQHQKTQLDNGLTILTCEKNDVFSVIIEVWIKAGSRYEKPLEHGVAHFVEHMNFKGTSKRSAKIIAEEFDAIGGYLNAYTSKEYTVYTVKVLREHLSLALEILPDIIFNSLYQEEEIEKERNVILQELGQSLDTPEEMVFEYFSETCFGKENIGRTILGTLESIKSIQKDNIIDFVRKHYIPEKIQVCAVGNVTHQEHVDLVEKFFNPFPTHNQESYTPSKYNGGIYQKTDQSLEQCHLVIGYPGVSLNHKDYYAYEIIANLFGGSVSSRLFQEIREKRGMVYSIGAFNQYYSDNGIFCINLNTGQNNFDEVLKILSHEIHKVTSDIRQDELDRSLAQVKSSLYMSYENIDNIVNILSGNYAWHNRYISPQEIMAGYNSVKLDDLQKIAKKIFSCENKIAVSSLTNFTKSLDYSELQNTLTV